MTKKALSKLGVSPEIEYFYSDMQIKDLMLKGSDDEFEDCLQFAPDGVKDLLKKTCSRTTIK